MQNLAAWLKSNFRRGKGIAYLPGIVAIGCPDIIMGHLQRGLPRPAKGGIDGGRLVVVVAMMRELPHE